MKNNSIQSGASADSSSGPSAAIRQRAKARPSKSNSAAPVGGTLIALFDEEKKQGELSAGPNQDTPEAGLDPTLPTNPTHGAPGHQVPESPSEDEDSEGRSMTEQLFGEGALQAEHDKVSGAAQEAEKDKRSAR